MSARVAKLGFDARLLRDLLVSALRQRLLFVLLAIDAGLILLHIGIIGVTPNEHLPPWTNWFRLSNDGSLAEIFEYLQVIGGAVLLLGVARTRLAPIVPIALILFYIVVDNALSLHEWAAYFILPDHQNRGELLVSAGIGLIMAAAGVFAFRHADRQERAAIIAVGLGVASIGAMAVGVDGLHAVGKQYSFALGRVLLVLEDGGELIAQSILLAVCFVVHQRLTASDAIASPAVDSGAFAQTGLAQHAARDPS